MASLTSGTMRPCSKKSDKSAGEPLLLSYNYAIMSKQLLVAAKIVCLDEADTIFEPGYILLEEDRIIEIGPFDERPSLTSMRILDLGNRLVMPGLVNAHTHTPMVLFRGLVEGNTLFNLDGWYNTVRVVEEVMTPDMVSPAVQVSLAEMIRTGTTTFADQYFWMDQIVPVVQKSGMRAALGYGIVELGDASARERELGAAADFLARLQDDPLLDAWVGPHAFFVDNQVDAMQQELALAQQYETGFHIHLGTSGEEDRLCQEVYGHSAITQLDQMGMLERPILAAHCLTVPEADFPLLAKKPFSAVINTSSSMRNAATAAPLKELLEHGVNTAMGTDNVANNNSYDMFKEMQLTGKLMSLVHQQPNVIPTRKILEMATLGGARALGLEDQIGSLEPGKQADLISLNLDEIGWAPFAGQDLYTALVYSITGQHVKDVMVAGQWLFRNNNWIRMNYANARKDLEAARQTLTELIA